MTWSELNYRMIAIYERKEREISLQCAIKNIKYSPRKIKKEVEKRDPIVDSKAEKVMMDLIKNKKLKLGAINGNK